MKKRKWLKPYLYCLSIAFLFLMICSKNSFLYQMNDWVDANAFFTVGKGMVRGHVPYQALFEQKGPLFYFIYGLGSLIRYENFFGVFLLEVISFSIFLFFSYKTITLFFEEKKANLILPLYTFTIVTLNSFSHGGSAEEFTLSFFMVSFYYLICYLKSKEDCISNKTVFLIGILAGSVLWIKYTLLGFWFGWMACIFGMECYRKRYKEALYHCIIYLFGMFVATLPWLIYFGIHNGLSDLWNVYFVVNMNAYPKSSSLFAKIYQTFYLLYRSLFGNRRTFLGIIISFIWLFMKKDHFGKKGFSLILFTCLLTTGIFIYIGGTSFHYYPFILAPFLIVGVWMVLSYLPNRNWNLWIIPSFILSLILTFTICGNVKMMFLKKEDYAQYQFAKIIQKSEESTLLNYGFLDGGFYTITGDIPKFYYFMKNNISYYKYPEMMDEQKRYIKEGLPHYVIIKSDLSLIHKLAIEKNYRLIDSHTQKYQTRTVTYLLYERK